MKVRFALALIVGLLTGAVVGSMSAKTPPDCGCKDNCECKPCRCAGCK